METGKTSDPYAFFLNGHNPADELPRLALEDFRDKSGLSGKTLESAGVRIFSGNSDTLKERLGFASFDGQPILKVALLVEIPSFSCEGKISGYHYRLSPPVDGTRYLQAKGQAARPYILPEVWAVKDKPNKPLWITEGAKKALKLIQHGRAAIGLMGVWNFRTDSEPFLFDDLERFTWKGRTVNFAFDMDFWTNPQVRFALFELTLKLMARGAVIRFVKWAGAKGIDDFLIIQKDSEEALNILEEKALPFDKFISLDHRDALLRALRITHAAFDDLGREGLVTTIAKRLGIRAKRLFAELAKKSEEIEPGYTADERASALELLKDPNLIQRFLGACHTRYLGRDKTLLLVKLATLTRHLDRGLSVVLSGTSSVGKSALIETVLKTCNPSSTENFSRTSAQYLLYREAPLDHRVVTFYELNGADSSAAVIRTAMTEGELRLGTVQKDAQGSLAAMDIRKKTEGIVILSTFTGSRVDPELATRVLLQEITHDESLARAVYRKKSEASSNSSDMWKLWQIADSLIDARPVHIPFFARLADLFPTKEERFHRDFDKTAMLIKASALFHQCQRPVSEDGEVIASEEDYKLVYSLGDAFAQSLLPVSSPVVNMLVVAKEAGALTRRELQDCLGLSLATIKRYTRQALKGEYIEVEGRGQAQTIRVVEIPEGRTVLPEPEKVFSLASEPVSQTPESVDTLALKLAQPLLSPSEPNELFAELREPNDSTQTAQTAHTGSTSSEPKNSLCLQGISQNGSTAHEEEDNFFLEEDDLPDVEIIA